MACRNPNGEPLLPQMANHAASEKAGSSENGNEALVHAAPVQFRSGSSLSLRPIDWQTHR